MKIVANCLVKNEDQWVWYALQSVLPYVDQVLVYDTGSTDTTVEIIKSISSNKIIFFQKKCSTPAQITECRQEMWKESDADWILMLDGDEIWRNSAIEKSILSLNDTLNYLISAYYNAVGDIYHYQPEIAGKYKIGDVKGHVTIRWINKKKHTGLHWEGNYPLEALCTSNNIPIQDDKSLASLAVLEPYIHTTHLKRSSRNVDKLNAKNKYKFELGITHPKTFDYPSVFYLPHPNTTPSPWQKRSLIFIINALWQTPLRYIKRSLV